MYTPQKPTFELADYPHEIAKARTAIARIDTQIAEIRRRLEQLELEIDGLVAFDPELKNDNQRRAKRGQLKHEQAECIELEANLKTAEQERLKLEIRLTLLRDMFSVAKLQRQLEIATLNSPELSGLGFAA